jgi:hypothetical protein
MPIQREAFSDYLHRRRIAIGKKWKAVLSNAYLSRATLHRIRHGDPYQPIAEVDSLRSLANALKFESWADLLSAYERNDVEVGLRTPDLGPATATTPAANNGEDAVLALSQALNLSPTELVRRLRVTEPEPPPRTQPLNGGFTLPSALLDAFRRSVKFVPHFSSGVAASELVEKLEEENPENRIPIDTEYASVFSVPVDGDCQHPVWKHGETVVFSFDAFEREGIIEGKSYYLAFADGSTTFKRVFLDAADPEVYILRCWNNRRYPTQRRVHFSQVVRIARAIAKQTNPELLDDDAAREAS